MEKDRNIEKILPERIKFYRRVRGITQGQLSEEVNVSEHYIAEIENAIKFPSMELIKNISIALDVPIYSLMQSQENIFDGRYNELKSILSAKDEEELRRIAAALLSVNGL